MKCSKSLLVFYIKSLVSHKFTLYQASQSTGYSIRRLSEIKAAYLKYGEICFTHGNKNRVPVNKISEQLRQKILAIYTSEYQGVNFRYFCYCLENYENIKIAYNTLRNIFRDAGIKSPEAHRTKHKKEVHRTRLRRENEGDLLQLDGTPYAWFKFFGNKENFCLSGSIDDATGKLTGLYLTKNECLYGYLEVFRQTITNYGIPREVYSDRAAIFCVTPKEKKNLTVWEQLAGIHDKRTQWQRILSILEVRQILAWTPQAKGRVERMWLTIQGQLPIWLKKHNANTVDKANKIIGQYIKEFNTNFSVIPKSNIDFWRKDTVILDDILQAEIPRKTNSNGQFKFHSYNFAVVECDHCACRDITLCINERGLRARIQSVYYPVKILDDITYGIGETMPDVLKDIIYRYMFAYAKELSA